MWNFTRALDLRGDFSRWVGDVCGDRALADELRVLEERHRVQHAVDTLPEMADAVRGRYDFDEEAFDLVEG